MENQTYIAIDLKSFYASVECADRGLNPLNTHLVVADLSRTEKTICLAVSPSLKAYGIPGRARLFEVVQAVHLINADRMGKAPRHRFSGKSYFADVLRQRPDYSLDYITAVPRMSRYMQVSSQIFRIYLKYIAPEDIHVYSIDEVFIDASKYLKLYHLTARELTMKMIQDVLHETGITATAGIGTNMYLCKIAMDVEAKHIEADENGVRIAELTEQSYREKLWTHRPLSDFWRIGHGIERKLISHGMYTMGDVARMSVKNEDLLYQLFGVNAELLIDHAWGWEPCTMKQVKSYRPASSSLSTGQVLSEPYDFSKGRIIVKEMADSLQMDLFEKRLVSNQLVLDVVYDSSNFDDPERRRLYCGQVVIDHYGKNVPKPAHGSVRLENFTCSPAILIKTAGQLYDSIADKNLLVRRFTVAAGNTQYRKWLEEADAACMKQPDLFENQEEAEKRAAAQKASGEKEMKQLQAILEIRDKWGKNAIVKGMNLLEGATMKERNNQIGGHRM